MASAGTVTVDFAAETAKFTAELQKVRKDLGGIRDQVASTNKALGGFKDAFVGALAVTGVVAGIHAVIEATKEAQAAIAQLDSGLGTTSANVPAASAELQRYATELQRTTSFSDEAVLGVETLLLSFQNLSGNTIKRATATVLDLSTRMGIDAPAAAKLLGKALSDPEVGMTALTRAGVIFSDQQKEQIKTFTDAGNIAKAQGVILDELGRRFHGAAEAARNTLGGALDGLKNQFGDLLEGSTGMPKAVESVNALANAFADPKMKEAADKTIGAVAVSVAALVKSAATAVGWVDKMAEGFAHLVIPTSGLDAAQALTQELQLEQIELAKMQRESYAHTAKEIEQQKAYIETLKQRIQLVKEALNVSPDKALQLSLDQPKPSTALDFKTGNGERQKTQDEIDYEAFQKKAALDRLHDDLGAGDVALKMYQDQQDRRFEFESNADRQIQDARLESEKETAAESQKIANDEIRSYIEHAEYRYELERDLQSRINALREGAVNAGIGLLQVFAAKHKAAAVAQILVNKGIAVAMAVQNTAAAATKALEIYGPTPLGFAMAGAAEAYGAVQIGLIAATGLAEIGATALSGTGGGAGVVTGPSNSANLTSSPNESTGLAGADARSAVQVTINGFIGKDNLREILDGIKEAVGAQDVVIIPTNSRQAMELRDGK